MRHIPNIISGLRLIMVGIFAHFFIAANYVACIGVYLLAFFSDLLDGYLARRNNWISDIGKVLDPLADKLMLLTAVLCFYLKGWLPMYMFIIIFAKEGLMLVGGMLLLKKGVVVFADWFGKFAAGFFTASVIVTLLKNFAPFERIGSFNLILFGIAIILALIALVHYAKIQVFSRHNTQE
ncbi:MAG: CDP-alcohol phosphatidyltransferase family protein [Clostridia bacterium]